MFSSIPPPPLLHTNLCVCGGGGGGVLWVCITFALFDKWVWTREPCVCKWMLNVSDVSQRAPRAKMAARPRADLPDRIGPGRCVGVSAHTALCSTAPSCWPPWLWVAVWRRSSRPLLLQGPRPGRTCRNPRQWGIWSASARTRCRGPFWTRWGRRRTRGTTGLHTLTETPRGRRRAGSAGGGAAVDSAPHSSVRLLSL